MSEGRSPAQIEADIVRRRQELAATLDEIAVRLHPKTIAGGMRAKGAAVVDRTAGRAYVGVNRLVGQARAPFVGGDGAPRMERIVPVALAAVALVTVVVGLSTRKRRG